MEHEGHRQGAEDLKDVGERRVPGTPQAAEGPSQGGPGEDPLIARLRADMDRYCHESGTVGPDRGEGVVRDLIRSVCDELRDFLLEKNASYGNSALEPIGVFSKLDAREGILLRIDDKLKRIRNGKSYPGDNDVKDLAGYLILLMVLREIDNV